MRIFSKTYMPLYLGVFSLTICISPDIGNIFLWLAILTALREWKYVLIQGHQFFVEQRNMCIAMVVFLVTLLMSAFFSGDIFNGINHFLGGYLRRMLPFFLIVLFIKEIYQVKRLILCIISSFCMADFYAILQGINGNLRANGFFGNPMTLGGFLSLLIPCVFILFIENQMIYDKKKILAGGFFLSFLALLFNGTRGAWVAMVIILPLITLVVVKDGRKNLVALLLAMMIVGTLIFSIPNLYDKVNTIGDMNNQSNNERFLMWRSAYHMFIDYPLLGVGLGQYEKAYQEKYILPEAKERKLGHAHNNFMQMIGENGILGLGGFLTLVGFFLWYGIYYWRSERNVAGLILAASLSGLLLQGLTEFNFGNAAVIKLYWLFTGTLVQYIALMRNVNK